MKKRYELLARYIWLICALIMLYLTYVKKDLTHPFLTFMAIMCLIYGFYHFWQFYKKTTPSNLMIDPYLLALPHQKFCDYRL